MGLRSWAKFSRSRIRHPSSLNRYSNKLRNSDKRESEYQNVLGRVADHYTRSSGVAAASCVDPDAAFHRERMACHVHIITKSGHRFIGVRPLAVPTDRSVVKRFVTLKRETRSPVERKKCEYLTYAWNHVPATCATTQPWSLLTAVSQDSPLGLLRILRDLLTLSLHNPLLASRTTSCALPLSKFTLIGVRPDDGEKWAAIFFKGSPTNAK
ncbi:hypothetical protein ALC56_08513 [Trachymyrmex septentrionalis]|uniref:Uncharacterized protein n=1 Tax=Trachymyrmex septentrionalis TaxID=34720 RepID=A0A195F937_9HYME|nr:hypothetical protein ALC56_08513 [Trachymyrmex septentrionalis]